MLSHGHWDENGYLAFAEHPEGPWYFRHAPTYTNTIALSNGSSVVLKQRERPQVRSKADSLVARARQWPSLEFKAQRVDVWGGGGNQWSFCLTHEPTDSRGTPTAALRAAAF